MTLQWKNSTVQVVALTGRSGCGKSTIARCYREYGYPVLDADKTAAEVLHENASCLQALADAFGADILADDGTLRRQLLADRAFATPDGQRKLTAITHPYIIRTLLERIAQEAENGARLVFVDGAVILGGPFEKYCDKIVVVDAPEPQQIARLCARDGISPQQAARRLSVQTPREKLLAAADAVIFNDGDVAQLLRRAQMVLQRLECGE